MTPREGNGIAAVLAAMLSTQALATWAVLALAAIAPMVAEAFALPAVFIGYQITIIYFVATMMSLFAGALVTRWGACRTSQICLAACALGCLIAVLPSLIAIAVASLAIGFAYGLTNPSSAHLLARRTSDHNRSLIFSIKQTGVPIGGMMAGLATPWLAAQWGWQVAVATIAPLALLLVILLERKRYEWDDDRIPGSPLDLAVLDGAKTLFRHRALQFLSFCGFCFGAIQLCAMTFIVTLAVVDLSFGPVLAGALLATAQAGGVAGRLAWGHIADRTRRNDIVLAGIGLVSALCCVALAFIGAETAPWVIFMLMVLMGASSIGWNGVFVAETVRLSPPAMVGSMVGMTTFCVFMGVLAGPPLFIQFYSGIGSYGTVFAIFALPALLGTASVILSRRVPGNPPS